MKLTWPFKRKDEQKRKYVKTVELQASSSAEGGSRQVILESMLTGLTLNKTIPGMVNAYMTYESQVQATYDKYNGLDSYGNQQTRAIVDLRVAFIAGEGISISCDDERTAKWIERFLQRNRLDGTNFINAVKGSEMAGQALFTLAPRPWLDGSTFIKATRVPYRCKHPYKPVYTDDLVRDEVMDVQIRKQGHWVRAGLHKFIYVRTGGDDGNTDGPSTRVGVVLTDLENYDRSMKDMRRNNHVFARITPVWQTDSDDEVASLRKQLADLKWKIGDSYIGKAKFTYETPGQGAHQNLTSELVATIKTISAVTGVPVHWLGYVDLMSNRSTAESLYELIKNATINERVEWENAVYNMILQAQELYIDAGGTDLGALTYDFEVKLPLIDFSNFLERVRGLSLAYSDTAISIDDYRNALPGIDPTKTARAVERAKEDEKSDIMTLIGGSNGRQTEGGDGSRRDEGAEA